MTPEFKQDLELLIIKHQVGAYANKLFDTRELTNEVCTFLDELIRQANLTDNSPNNTPPNLVGVVVHSFDKYKTLRAYELTRAKMAYPPCRDDE